MRLSERVGRLERLLAEVDKLVVVILPAWAQGTRPIEGHKPGILRSVLDDRAYVTITGGTDETRRQRPELLRPQHSQSPATAPTRAAARRQGDAVAARATSQLVAPRSSSCGS